LRALVELELLAVEVAAVAAAQAARPQERSGSVVKVKVAPAKRGIERVALVAQAEEAAPVGLPAARVEEEEAPVG
jgi:hypothetical protein